MRGLAVCGGARPFRGRGRRSGRQAFPVNHVYDRETGCVAFPTNRGTKLHGALDWPWVAYEVDGLDPDGDGGWSVAVVGRAEAITDSSEISRLAEQRQVLWRPGETSDWVRIVPSKVTGRRISATKGTKTRSSRRVETLAASPEPSMPNVGAFMGRHPSVNPCPVGVATPDPQ